MKILITANSSFNIVNFRAGLVRTLMANGHDVVTLVPFDDYTDAIRQELGCRVIELKMDRRGTSPLTEGMTLLRMARALYSEKPDVVIGYTIKNNIYGGLAGRLMSIPILPNITGLGTIFSTQSFLSRLARQLYKIAFKRAPVVFFQNEQDAAEFTGHDIVPEKSVHILPGSGVDLHKFAVAPLPDKPDAPVFLLIGRMLWEKGVGEFVEAAKRVKAEHPSAEFWLVGGLETPGDEAIPEPTLTAWEREGAISYLGKHTNIKPVIDSASCVVLPTYYKEGTPRALLESASMGRPLITTDTPGCRNTVKHAKSGYLVAPRDVDELTEAMAAIATASHEELTQMGHAGRAHIETNYDEKIVIAAYQEALSRLTDNTGVGKNSIRDLQNQIEKRSLNAPKGDAL